MATKILFVLMPKDFKDVEFATPYQLCKEAQYTVTVAGLEIGTCTGVDGIEVKTDTVLATLSKDELATYDALVIPGGPGSPTYLWNNAYLQKIIALFHEQKKVIAAICWATVSVAKSGILLGKRATVYPTDDAKLIFTQERVEYVPTGVVVLTDERIITAQSPEHAEAFGQSLISLLTTL